MNKIALNKPSNIDFFTAALAEFVETFEKIALPKFAKHLFFIEGGALAVENALRIALDWKVQKNFLKGHKEERGTQVIHFKEAFHGRTGYTLSLINTDLVKIPYSPKFNWI